MNEPEFLLDSNILIYLLRGISPSLRTRVETSAPGELATSTIAYAEVMRGIGLEDPVKMRAAGNLFSVITVLAFDVNAAEAYRRVPFHRGKFDRLIAAHTLSMNLTLVTNNERDFADIPGLRVENWTL